MQGAELYTMLGLVLLTMAIIWGLPKLTKKVPAALTAIIITTANARVVLALDKAKSTIPVMTHLQG